MFKKLSRYVPCYAVIPLISCWLWNMLVYGGTRYINRGMTHYDMTTSLDLAVPVIPATMIIYFGCFAFWVVFYCLCGRAGQNACARFVAFDMMTRLICGIFFILLPTCNERPIIAGNDIFEQLLLFLYWIDEADNLFPSIHCLVSWNCFVGIRGLKCYSWKYKTAAFVMAILVFISTLTTRQHVIADIVSAVAVSEICWFVVGHTRWYLRMWKVFEKVNQSVFRIFNAVFGHQK